MVPQPPLREPESENWDFFLKLPGTRSPQDQEHVAFVSSKSRNLCLNSQAPAPGAARRHISNCVSQLFGDRAVDRQCHWLFFDLRRQPSHHTLAQECRRTRVRHGPTLSSKTTQSLAWDFGSRIDKQTEFARELYDAAAGSIGDELVARS